MQYAYLSSYHWIDSTKQSLIQWNQFNCCNCKTSEVTLNYPYSKCHYKSQPLLSRYNNAIHKNIEALHPQMSRLYLYSNRFNCFPKLHFYSDQIITKLLLQNLKLTSKSQEIASIPVTLSLAYQWHGNTKLRFPWSIQIVLATDSTTIYLILQN